MHICVGNLTIIGSDIGLSSGRRPAIIWTNVGILLCGALGTNLGEMLIKLSLSLCSSSGNPFTNLDYLKSQQG